MKTLKKTAALLALILLGVSTVKAELPVRKGNVASQVIDQYIEARTMGKVEGISTLFSDQFMQYVKCNLPGFCENKEKFLKQIALTKGHVMNCETELTYLEETDEILVAKIEFKFPTFSRMEYITLHNQEEGWQLVSISIAYES